MDRVMKMKQRDIIAALATRAGQVQKDWRLSEDPAEIAELRGAKRAWEEAVEIARGMGPR